MHHRPQHAIHTDFHASLRFQPPGVCPLCDADPDNPFNRKEGEKVSDRLAVYKYDLPITDDVIEIDMPVGAQILHLGWQPTNARQVQMWALVDPDPTHPVQHRRFRIYGTGHPIPNPHELRHVGTVLTFDGQLVWHVFEVM